MGSQWRLDRHLAPAMTLARACGRTVNPSVGASWAGLPWAGRQIQLSTQSATARARKQSPAYRTDLSWSQRLGERGRSAPPIPGAASASRTRRKHLRARRSTTGFALQRPGTTSNLGWSHPRLGAFSAGVRARPILPVTAAAGRWPPGARASVRCRCSASAQWQMGRRTAADNAGTSICVPAGR